MNKKTRLIEEGIMGDVENKAIKERGSDYLEPACSNCKSYYLNTRRDKHECLIHKRPRRMPGVCKDDSYSPQIGYNVKGYDGEGNRILGAVA